jgi:hypothetical protein
MTTATLDAGDWIVLAIYAALSVVALSLALPNLARHRAVKRSRDEHARLNGRIS